MNDCPFQPLLDACHDGELDAAMQRRFALHLGDCPACAAGLEALDDLSVRIAITAAGAATGAQDCGQALARMHRAIDRAAAAAAQRGATQVVVKPWSSRVVRFAAPFAAIAASILIVGGVWLLDAMRPSKVIEQSGIAESEAPQRPMLAVAPDWERMATTLRADPRWEATADGPFAPHYADAIHWMLEGLKLTEETPWPLPKSF
jgi:anti-sigma factor RsiW